MAFTNTVTFKRSLPSHQQANTYSFWQKIHIDIYLFLGVFLLIAMGLLILYSASSQNLIIIKRQIVHISIAMMIMLLFAQIPPIIYSRWAVLFYSTSLLFLFAVLLVGHTGKGAERWLNLGILRFQPSELMKLALPLFLAMYCHHIHLPLTLKPILFSAIIILIPVLLTAKQPDLSTAILLIIAGGGVLFFAGLSWLFLGAILSLGALSTPVFWYFMHNYQQQRVLTFLNPERDPLGAGYHIIQSKIAIGSGGFFGKGWLHGSQSHLHFLPEHTTDFIFAVCGEEFGFLGNIILILIFMAIILRGLYITAHAQDTFSRLLAGSLTLVLFFSFFINMGMVTGILPVMGLPLPFISYGGSSMVTLMASIGILMSIQTHRKLLTT